MNESRRASERDAYTFFNNKVNIKFTYNDDVVEWFVTAVCSDWIPREWFDYYCRPTVDEETELAMSAIYLLGATTTMRLTNGERPETLLLCRYCGTAVFSSPDLREQHIFGTHRKQLAELFM